MPIVRFARAQQRTLLVAVVAAAATGAFGAGVWLGTQPLPGSGSARAALAAEEQAIALVGSNRAPTSAQDGIEVIEIARRFDAGPETPDAGPAPSDTAAPPAPADPQPSPAPSPVPVPIPPAPVPLPTDPVVDAVEDALNGIIGPLPVSAPAPGSETVTALVPAPARSLLP